MQFITDCLVLKIEEFSIKTVSIDNTVYVLYDQKDERYIIRGQRNGETSLDHNFSYNCENIKSLEYFISFIMCQQNLLTVTLYNLDNLPYDSKNITYDYLSENTNDDNELAEYEKVNYSTKRLKNLLKTIKNVFNNYN
jgi:hypothetical protein